jgi:hypothetical protein
MLTSQSSASKVKPEARARVGDASLAYASRFDANPFAEIVR